MSKPHFTRRNGAALVLFIALLFGTVFMLYQKKHHKAGATELSDLSDLSTVSLVDLKKNESALTDQLVTIARGDQPLTNLPAAYGSLDKNELAKERLHYLTVLLNKVPHLNPGLLFSQDIVDELVREGIDSTNLEHATSATGTFETVHTDNFTTKKSTTTSYLTVDSQPNAKPLIIHFSDVTPEGIAGGSRVSIKGIGIGNDVLISKNDLHVLAPPPASSFPMRQLAPLSSGADLKNILIIPVEWNNLSMDDYSDDNSKAIGPQKLNDIISQVDTYYQKSIPGTVKFKSSAALLQHLSYDIDKNALCNNPGIGDKVVTQLIESIHRTQPTLDLTQFTTLIIYLPHLSIDDPCPWTGRSNTIPGNKVWISHSLMPSIWAHELGHNLGMYHADSFIGQIYDEYGNYADVMGNGQDLTNLASSDLDGPHKEQIAKQKPGVKLEDLTKDVSSNQSFDKVFTISDLEGQAASLLELKIADGRELAPEAANKNDVGFYIEYRKQSGKVMVNAYNSSLYPATSTGDTTLIGSSDDGNPFLHTIIAGIDLTVTDEGHSGDQAKIHIQAHSAQCRDEFSFSSDNTRGSGFAGETLPYSFNTTLTDPDKCPAIKTTMLYRSDTSDDMTTSLLPGWKAEPNVVTITNQLNEGHLFQITSSPNAKPGVYTIHARPVGGLDAADNLTTYTYRVKLPCVTQNPTFRPTSPLSVTGKAGEKITTSIIVTDNDSVNCPGDNWKVTLTPPLVGWSQSLDSPSLYTEPKDGGQDIKLTVTSPINSPNGTQYPLTLTFTNEDDVEKGVQPRVYTYKYNYTVGANKCTPIPGSSSDACTNPTPPPCPIASTLSLDPATDNQTVQLHQFSAPYTVNFTSGECDKANWDISADVPQGFSYAVDDPQSVTLAFGTMDHHSIKVAPGGVGDVSPGTYTFTVKYTNHDHPEMIKSVIGHITVLTATSPPTPTPTPLACASLTGTVTPSPQTGAPGQTLPYTVSFSNNSSDPTCTDFTLSALLPSNYFGSGSWTVKGFPASLSLAPSKSTSFPITVTSPEDSPSGNFTIGVKATSTISNSVNLAEGDYQILNGSGNNGQTTNGQVTPSPSPVAISTDLPVPSKVGSVLNTIQQDVVVPVENFFTNLFRL